VPGEPGPRTGTGCGRRSCWRRLALACQLPAATGVPLSRWSAPELAAQDRDFGSTGQLAATLLAFTARYQPDRPALQLWKYTATDLAGTLDRISARQQPAKPPASLPEAA
jgi:hypothetical protein